MSSEEKFRTVINLKSPIFLKSLKYFFVQKKIGSSFLFSDTNFYKKSLSTLYNFSVLPFLEAKIEKSFNGIRPFRNCIDIFVEIRNFLIINKKDKMLYKSSFFPGAKSFERVQLFKHFPFENDSFKSYLYYKNSKLIIESSENFFISFDDFTKFNRILFNVLLNGLLRISHINTNDYIKP